MTFREKVPPITEGNEGRGHNSFRCRYQREMNKPVPTNDLNTQLEGVFFHKRFGAEISVNVHYIARALVV